MVFGVIIFLYHVLALTYLSVKQILQQQRATLQETATGV